MEIKIQKTLTIHDETDWLIAAPPQKGLAQWKDGKSAKELAKYATLGKKAFNNLINRVIKDCYGIKVKSLTGEPEATTNLPFSTSGPRQHDLLLHDDNNEIVIGIEAKVDEPFGDKSIYKENENASESKSKRIKWLLNTLLPPQYQDINNENVKDIGYQLFTGVAGTLLEAYRRKAQKCIFLVISLHEANENNLDNENAFNGFVRIICGDNTHKMFKICEEGDSKREIDCYFVYEKVAFSQQTYDDSSH